MQIIAKRMNKIGNCCAVAAVAWAGLGSVSATASAPARRQVVALVKQAETAFYASNYQKAEQLCRQANRLDPGYVRAYTWLGATYEKRGENQQALQSYRKVLALAPRSQDARHARLRLSRLGSLSNAAPVQAKATPAKPAVRELDTASAMRIFVNGQSLVMGATPVMQNGRVLVPLRLIFERLGAQVSFDGVSKTINAQRGASQLQMHVGAAQALLNGQQVTLDEPPLIVDNTVMVPLRLVAQAMGARVGWDGAQTVDIDTSEGTLKTSRPTIAAVPQAAQSTLPSDGGPSSATAPSISAPSTSTPASPPAGVSPPADSADLSRNEAAPVTTPVTPETVVPVTPTPTPIARPSTPPASPTESGLPRPAPETLQPAPATKRAEPRRIVPAQELLVTGKLQAAGGTTRVLGRAYPQMFVLSGRDQDLTFQLDKGFGWFEAQVAVADNAPSTVAEMAGWFDDSPTRMAFDDLRLFSNQLPTPIRLRVAGAARLTLAPVFPGYPVVNINPRFVRDP